MPLLIAILPTALGVLLAVLLASRTHRFVTGTVTLLLASLVEVFLAWLTLPVVGFWFGAWLWYFAPALLIGTVLGLSTSGRLVRRGHELDIVWNGSTKFGIALGFWVVYVGGFGLLVPWVTSTPMLHASAYASMLQVESRVFSDDVPLASTEQIRLTPWWTARAQALKVLGQDSGGVALGSQLTLDESSAAIQEIHGGMWWVIPLDFSGPFKWYKRDSVPAYILVSAEEANGIAKLVNVDEPFRYTPGAYLGYNADRVAWNAVPTLELSERTAEIDEDGKLFYVYSGVYPTIGFGGQQTAGVVILDPVSGATEFVSADKVPTWVDRVKPMAQAVRQTDYWGEYSGGWINATFGSTNLREAAGDEAHFVRLGDHNYWFAGVTSKSGADEALVGLMFVDTQATDNRAIFYTMSGTIEQAALRAVEGSLGADAARWAAVEPVPYNIHGVPTFVIPVIDGNTHLLQRIALLDIRDVGNLVTATDLPTALRLYATKLTKGGEAVAAPTVTANTRTHSGVVSRHGMVVDNGTSTHLFAIEGEDRIFAVQGSSAGTLAAPLVNLGDVISVTFEETEQQVVAVSSLTIATLDVPITTEPTPTP